MKERAWGCMVERARTVPRACLVPKNTLKSDLLSAFLSFFVERFLILSGLLLGLWEGIVSPLEVCMELWRRTKLQGL